MIIYCDAHIHAYELSEEELRNLFRNRNFVLLSVSEDISSSLKNIRLSLIYENIIPAVGIHPWNAHKISKSDLEKIYEIIKKENISVIGEIGLDKLYYRETFEKQREIFEFFLKIAKEYDLSVNLHSTGAWREVFENILKFDIKKVYFHWYTGPINLLEEIEKNGYFIGINVACIFQKKQEEILEKINLDNLLTESDGPYLYKNNLLHPFKLEDLYKFISDKKKIDILELGNKIKINLNKFLY